MKPAVTRKTTTQLNVGDKVQHGNIVIGFTYTEIVAIRPSKSNRMLHITEKFAHGGVGGHLIGKNANWYVVVGA